METIKHYLFTESLKKRSIQSKDGEIGHCSDFLFHDDKWRISYLVVATGGLLSRREVLISPEAILVEDMKPDADSIPLNLDRETIENSPRIGEERPVSLEYEKQLSAYYAWPTYGGPSGMLGGPASQVVPMTKSSEYSESLENIEKMDTPNLRSTNELLGYDVLDRDGGKAASVEDLEVNLKDFSIPRLKLKTGPLLQPVYPLLEVKDISEISFRDRSIRTNLEAEAIRELPASEKS
jgi:sporulation protein YlmC with PRC-barrel domain